MIASVAGRGLLDAAKDLLFVANARSCGTELLRHAHLHRQQTKTPDVTGCVETEVGSGNPEPIFVSGGCGPDVDGTEHVVGEDGESHPAFDPSPDRRRSSRLS